MAEDRKEDFKLMQMSPCGKCDSAGQVDENVLQIRLAVTRDLTRYLLAQIESLSAHLRNIGSNPNEEPFGDLLLRNQSGTTADVGFKVDLYEEVRNFEKKLIEDALQRSEGNQKQAAKLLNLNPSTLNYKIRSYEIRFLPAFTLIPDQFVCRAEKFSPKERLK